MLEGAPLHPFLGVSPWRLRSPLPAVAAQVRPNRTALVLLKEIEWQSVGGFGILLQSSY
jgi:hypothetical protein